jgi:stage IV sporulation protein A
MLNYDIYDDIAIRTGGDIYLGVVGAGSYGKIDVHKKFMELAVLDRITDKNKLQRAIDELPQSGDGKTITTTEPKFVPNEAVQVNFGKMTANLRLIDCVGYLVEDAIGHKEGDKQRLVKTPWSDEEMTFQKAAELGTTKVIREHSTVGILVTTDGSVTDIARAKYVDSEERVVAELKSCGKPFVIVLNSRNPSETDTVRLRESLEEKYGAPVVCLDIAKMSIDDVQSVMGKALYEFPVTKVNISIPKWMRSMTYDEEIIKDIIDTVRTKAGSVTKMRDTDALGTVFSESGYIENDPSVKCDLATGEVEIACKAKDGLYFSVLSKECGHDVDDDYKLLTFVKKLSKSYNDYEGIRSAMEKVKTDGYGVVNPTLEDMELAEPELVKKGNQYGVKLRASAPSYHIVKVDVETEISPTIGSEQQSEDLVKDLLGEFENNKKGIWETNMFGVTLNSLVKEDLNNKLGSMSADTQAKLRRTISRIVNEGKGGVLCILL